MAPTIGAILKKQKLILQGSDADNNKHWPKVIYECYMRLKILLGKEDENNIDVHSMGSPIKQINYNSENLEDSILLPVEYLGSPSPNKRPSEMPISENNPILNTESPIKAYRGSDKIDSDDKNWRSSTFKAPEIIVNLTGS